MGIEMSKKDGIVFLGLTEHTRNYISVSNFDVPQNTVERVIYIDGRGYEWAYLWGAFYRVDRSNSQYYHTVER